MTNTSEEVSANCPRSKSEEEAAVITTMMPRGASYEAPSMHCNTFCDDDDTIAREANELFVTAAAGNAAKAARRVGFGLRRTNNNLHDKDITKAESMVRDTTNIHNDFDDTTTASSSDDDDDDGLFNEEEDGAYKTCSSATLSQSVHILQPEEQPKALIATFGLFLVQAWNWLHYLFVTIIFLNYFDAEKPNFADKSRKNDEVVHNFCGGGSVQGGETETEFTSDNTTVVEESSSLTSPVGNMSPNTCSIQNQEESVEKAEEAIIMAATTTTITAIAAQEKVEVTAAGVQEQQQQLSAPQIQIILSEVPEKTPELDENLDDDDVDEGVEEGEEVVEMGVALARRDSVDSYTSSEGSGNLGDAEEDNVSCDKSSTSTEENDNSNSNNMMISSSNDNNDDSGKPLSQKIVSQVEAMFSDEHLAKDGFLLKHVRRRSDGFVSLKLVAGLRKVKQISRDFPQVLIALRDSTKLEINAEGTKIRRAEPLTAFLKAVPIKAKEKGPGKDKENGSSNDENQQPPTTNHQQNNKSPSRSGKENLDNARSVNNNQNGNNNNNRRNSTQNQSNVNNNGGSQSRRKQQRLSPDHRKSSNTSTASSNNSRPTQQLQQASTFLSSHPADLLRNVYSSVVAYSSSGEESQSPQVGRRRGGSLPITALQRTSGAAYLSPNSSPPGNGAFITIGPNGARPKSNSYCEGTSPTTMSPWLLKRKASASSRLSNGELTFSGVVRQPRGPDGTKGFASGYRAMILEERLQQQTNSAVSA
ncbi:La-related protein 6 [Orchesella cincta]|uniref:La-related protein 6 n=1 Tax=Orchesella cincta TaxID=48709 RepID=A0A1D2N201_ORCCI|nr:La-related protein 6 [Orchesella cincta]